MRLVVSLEKLMASAGVSMHGKTGVIFIDPQNPKSMESITLACYAMNSFPIPEFIDSILATIRPTSFNKTLLLHIVADWLSNFFKQTSLILSTVMPGHQTLPI
jgi:hypothetical protein